MQESSVTYLSPNKRFLQWAVDRTIRMKETLKKGLQYNAKKYICQPGFIG